MNQESEESSGHGGVTWVALIVLIPVLYVLSVGPVILVLEKTSKSHPPIFIQFYAPCDLAL